MWRGRFGQCTWVLAATNLVSTSQPGVLCWPENTKTTMYKTIENIKKNTIYKINYDRHKKKLEMTMLSID